MCQNGCPNGRGHKSLKLLFFSLVPLWVPLGSLLLHFALPGQHFGTFWVHFCWVLQSLGIILAPLGPTKMIPRECKIQWKWILIPPRLCSFLLNFEVPGHHFGTLGPTTIRCFTMYSVPVSVASCSIVGTDPALPGSPKFNAKESSNQPGRVHFCWILNSMSIILAPLQNVICSCVRCIMQHSRNRSSTTREPKIQCKWILKDPALPGSLKFNANESSKQKAP